MGHFHTPDSEGFQPTKATKLNRFVPYLFYLNYFFTARHHQKLGWPREGLAVCVWLKSAQNAVWIMGWVQQAQHHDQHRILNCLSCKMPTFWLPARNWSSQRWEQSSNLIPSNEVNSFWIEELSWKLWQFITCSKLIKLQGRRKDQQIACYWHN